MLKFSDHLSTLKFKHFETSVKVYWLNGMSIDKMTSKNSIDSKYMRRQMNITSKKRHNVHVALFVVFVAFFFVQSEFLAAISNN